jgi:hypothetical protein
MKIDIDQYKQIIEIEKNERELQETKTKRLRTGSENKTTLERTKRNGKK